ncbi:MAG: zinc ribbon domain-containing protein [Candidatus Thorarchaeota archaeon]
MTKNDDNPMGLLIPIGVLFIVMVGIREPWLLVPIVILAMIFVSGVAQSRSIRAREREYDYWKAPEPGTYTSGAYPEPTKPIYDQKKQKDQGITCGTLIPIIIVGWLYLNTLSWVFLIPLIFLFAALIETATKQNRGKTRVRDQLLNEEVRTVTDIADSTGMTEERVRQHIVTDKRSGQSDVWFDPSSGQVTHTPISVVEPTLTKVGCTYCGFALKSEDRFCPYCGAPIKS